MMKSSKSRTENGKGKESFKEESAPHEHDTSSDSDEEKSPKTAEGFNDDSSPKKNPYPNILSPTNTHVTIEMSPSPTQTIEIEERGPSRSMALLFGMKKPVLLFVAFLLVSLAVTTFFGWFEVPGLNDQISRLGVLVKDLDGEVNRLTEEVNRLRAENERYRSLNDDLTEVKNGLEEVSDELNSTVIELEETNNQLNASTFKLRDEVVDLEDSSLDLNTTIIKLQTGLRQLNATNEVLEKQVQELEDTKDVINSTVILLKEGLDDLEGTYEELQEIVLELEKTSAELNATTIEYTHLNENLTVVVGRLTQDLGNLKTSVDTLTGIGQDLMDLEKDLTELVQGLNDTSVGQDELLVKLQADLVNFTAENDRLEALNSNIDQIIGLVNDPNFTGGDTISGVSNWLRVETVKSKNLLTSVRSTLIGRYEQVLETRKDDWFCNFEYQFSGFEWASKTALPIDDAHLDSVFDYIEERFLRPQCLDTSNFRSYDEYENSGSNSGISFQRLSGSIDRFTTLVEDYYFSPFDTNTKITIENWVNASYECENLENNYLWKVPSRNIFNDRL